MWCHILCDFSFRLRYIEIASHKNLRDASCSMKSFIFSYRLNLAHLSRFCNFEETNMAKAAAGVINCAHRGASGHAPENTLAAIRLAMAMHAQMCEIDVQRTADGHLVLLHDDTLNRTTTGEGALVSKSLLAVKTYDAGSWFGSQFAGEPVPTLHEVITAARGRIKLNIEIKRSSGQADVTTLLVQMLLETDFTGECIVTSFDHQLVDELQWLAPELTTGYIFNHFSFHAGVFDGPASILSAHHLLVNERFVQQARAAHKTVHVWTVNDEPLMHKFIELGVAAIITNYPDRLASVLAGRSQR